MSLIRQQIDSFLQGLNYNYFAICRFDVPPSHQKIFTLPKTNVVFDSSNVVNFESFKVCRPINFISSYPEEWLNLYFNGFYEVDPVLLRSKKTFMPFMWGEGINSLEEFDLPKQEELFAAAKRYDISKGITVPIGNLNNMKAAITLTFGKNVEINSTKFFAIAWHLAHLGNFVCYLQDKYDKGEALEQEELLEIYKFLSNSHHSCQAI
ncbi:autoinducer binding domain-containing protein [Candidatus Paracaedibacter symbiosus]|uniref:autoinducer binding domain-containing protein n=1 Tax=Candidatus Paracaedibacter symbiosus TaxID=244582 RepID=UPI000509D68C|nr:autoinducer binding domain-containing protein [Candidatus Paracaedibacter symbiosus]